MKLRKETSLDPEILDFHASDLSSVFEGPTLFDLRNPNVPPVFVSVLLHGNEISGWDALRSLLKEQLQAGESASMYILIGNVQAASQNVRALDEQPDFNRIWQGNHPTESDWTQDVIAEVASGEPWFALDIHNNTCPNPHHSVITDMDPATLSVAREFSDIAIFAAQPPGVLSRRCSQFCTAITIEVGTPWELESAARAKAFLSSLIKRGSLPTTSGEDLRIYRNNIRVVIEKAHEKKDWQVPNFTPDLNQWNFTTLEKGTSIAQLKPGGGRLVAHDDHMHDVTNEFLEYKGDEVLLARDVIMSMYTEDPRIALQDCVCYFLEPWDFSDQELAAS
ncbi:MAG: succinylglutamate desuccinylase/aspartoacylase family protein [Gammaproteobacteria bacterium]|nr:succinylglutamate desuccinylase/aspartoacylase family protein [Gammaproteobacteria bacterium]